MEDNNLRVDFHVHSYVSDGTVSPREVVKLAADAGLVAMALTDHDTVDGVEEALKAGEEYGIKVIPGIELSADYKGSDLHILGLNVDYVNEGFREKVAVCRDSRHNRNLKMIEKLNECGINITWDIMLERFGSKSITRAHFAKYMIDEGYVADKDEAFNKYLNPGCPCYVSRVKISPFEAIDIIKAAGGHPVLAHPLLYKMPYDRLESVIVMLQNHGLEGIEGRYALNKVEDDNFLDKIAKRHNLKMTGGSDFHGAIKPDIFVGVGKGNLKVYENMCSWIYE
ncbi:MAG: PHP domain-containing protein [Lachnospiraceae bacterium]|nr:PHP domain-containing protein [Lachnospiraceae bacterium]